MNSISDVNESVLVYLGGTIKIVRQIGDINEVNLKVWCGRDVDDLLKDQRGFFSARVKNQPMKNENENKVTQVNENKQQILKQKETNNQVKQVTEEVQKFDVGSPQYEEFLDTNTNPNSSKHQKPKTARPKYISYIETIPEQYRNIIFSNISSQLINGIVKNLCPQLVRPILQKRKKEYEKKIKEERLQKQRDEERQKLEAMRKRKEIAIQNTSKNLVKSIIRSFIHSEIFSIFQEEIEKVKEETIPKTIKIDENKAPPPVVLTGLFSRKHLNPTFLKGLFSGYNFVLDEKREPKILFRYNGNRYDALLYFSTNKDVMNALSRNPIQVDYTTAQIYLENDEIPNTITLFNNQKVLLSNSRNSEGIISEHGKSDYISMSPVSCLESFCAQEEEEE